MPNARDYPGQNTHSGYPTSRQGNQSADPHSGECGTAGGDKVPERAIRHREHRDRRHGQQVSPRRLPKADEQQKSEKQAQVAEKCLPLWHY